MCFPPSTADYRYLEANAASCNRRFPAVGAQILLLRIAGFFLLCLSTLPSLPAADFGLPLVDPHRGITASAKQVTSGSLGSYEVHQLSGNAQIRQGEFEATGEQLTLWIDRTNSYGTEKPVRMIVQVSGQTEVSWSASERLKDRQWTGRLFTHLPPDLKAAQTLPPMLTPPPVPWSGSNNPNDSSVVPAQFVIGEAPQNSLPMQSFGSGNSPLGGIVLDNQGNIVEQVPANPNNQQTQQSFQLPAPNPRGNDANPLAVPGQIPSTLGPAFGAVPSISPNPETGTVPLVDRPRRSIGADSFEYSGRGSAPTQVQSFPDPVRGETTFVITGGVRLRFAGAAIQGNSSSLDLGTVLLEADRVVIWTGDIQRLFSGNVQGLPIEVYLEGNVIFQQGQRKIYAERMYYNAQAEFGTILNAEILTPVPQYEGLLRLKADVVQQRSRQNFLAYDAAMTSSRLGVPRYWLQADKLELTDERDPTDPNQYETAVRTGTTNMEATARNNFIYVGGIPVFYWPYLNTNIDTPSFYVKNIKIKNDTIFGQQVFVDTDLYQILGIDGPDGTDWRLSTDYLSERGFALGTTYRYNVPKLFFDGPATGFIDVWGLRDRGLDTLGGDRVNLTPEEQTRGRGLLRNRQMLSPDLELRAEVGYISDRNFVEQFFEREWDTQKDETTTLRARRYADNQMLDLWGQVRLNDFFTETQWLPRLDFYLLGQPILDRFTLYGFSHVGYADQKIASTPTDPQDAAKFQLQPYETNSSGIRAGTRQELALPLNAGPVKIVPYVNGEIMTYGEDVNGQSFTRYTGQTGIRTSLPFWQVFEGVQSRIFNVDGLAHKASLNAEYFYADSSQNVSRLPLYDPLDDNAQEHFRRRLVFNTFGGALPPQFDVRSYAIRQGLQRYVTAASQDVVDDQQQFRLGLDQRFQTKRGLPGRERITDLFEFDVAGILYPKADRDNFGETVGALNFDSRLHLGDRVTLLSDGYADVFDSGLKILSGGAMISRPGRGDWYVGLTRLTGPINSTIFHSNINYRLNEKFIVTGGTTFDLGEVGNVGQSFNITRIGESFLAQIGIAVDSGRDNATFNFNFEPRFLPIRGLSAVGGKLIPPAGLYGLE